MVPRNTGRTLLLLSGCPQSMKVDVKYTAGTINTWYPRSGFTPLFSAILGLQSLVGHTPLKFQVVLRRNGTAVLDGLMVESLSFLGVGSTLFKKRINS